MDSFALICTAARRGGRCPAALAGGAVFAARRLRSGPGQRPGPSPGTNSPQDCLCPGSVHRPAGARQNSLRSLRELRSNSCRESVHEARCARRPQPCAPRHPTSQRCGTPAAAHPMMLVRVRAQTRVPAKAGADGRWRAFAQPRSAGSLARARSALRCLTHGTCSSAAGAARGASCAVGPRIRASQGTPAQRGPATKRHRPSAPAFARATS